MNKPTVLAPKALHVTVPVSEANIVPESLASTSIESQQAVAGQKGDDRVWVACNRCDKWRALPSTVDAKSLPDVWLCEFNTYDPAHANCDVPEETYVQPDAPLKVREYPPKSF